MRDETPHPIIRTLGNEQHKIRQLVTGSKRATKVAQQLEILAASNLFGLSANAELSE